jgi:hypothetical protein
MVVLIGIILLIVFILIIRLFGAWMLRIDEIIKLQKEMLLEMKKHSQQNIVTKISPSYPMPIFEIRAV